MKTDWHFSILVLLCSVYSLVESKHVHLRKNAVSGAHGGDHKDETVDGISPNNEFLQESLQKQFSWSDPALVAHLWGGAERVPKAPYDVPNSISGQSHREERSLEKRVYRTLYVELPSIMRDLTSNR